MHVGHVEGSGFTHPQQPVRLGREQGGIPEPGDCAVKLRAHRGPLGFAPRTRRRPTSSGGGPRARVGCVYGTPVELSGVAWSGERFIAVGGAHPAQQRMATGGSRPATGRAHAEDWAWSRMAGWWAAPLRRHRGAMPVPASGSGDAGSG